jgi:hypothetical protein
VIPPRPWCVVAGNDDLHEDDPSWIQILGADGSEVTASDALSSANGKATAELIVRLVNAEPEIVAALEAARDALALLHNGFGITHGQRNIAINAVRTALAKVRP